MYSKFRCEQDRGGHFSGNVSGGGDEQPEGLAFPRALWLTGIPSVVRHDTPLGQGKNDETFRLLVESVVDYAIVMLDPKGFITSWNPGARRLTGYDKNEVIGKHFSMLFSQEDVTDGKPASELEVAAKEGRIEDESWNLRKDGKPFWANVITTAIRDEDGVLRGFSRIARDATDGRPSDDALRLTVERLQLAAKAGNVGIWEWDCVADVVTWDEQVFALYGLDPATVRPGVERWKQALHPEDRERALGELQAALNGEKPFQAHFRIIRAADRSIRYVRSIATVIRDENGKPLRLIGTNWDVTEERAREEKLHTALANEKDLAEQAQEGMRAKSEFLAMMSHEIRTPMNGILGFAELLARSPNLPEDCKDYAETITQSGQALLRIIDDILDFSRIEAGRMRIDKSAFSPRKVAGNVHALLSQQAAEKKLDFRVIVEENVPEQVKGDPGRLRQILVNLVGNAVKFTPKGAVTLTVRISSCVLTSSDATALDFCVEDSGKGIPASDLEQIFEPFVQGEAGVSSRSQGSGLGLAISRRLVGLMHGRISARNRISVGSEFLVTIPFANVAETAGAPPETLKESLDESFASRKPMRVMVVEDDAPNLRLIVTFLRNLGYEAIAARDGREAVKIFEEQRPDCILMDLQMPEMDGVTATEAIRQLEKSNGWKPVFISALTANIFAAARSRCLEAGMDFYMPKPLKRTMLAEALTQAHEQVVRSRLQ